MAAYCFKANSRVTVEAAFAGETLDHPSGVDESECLRTRKFEAGAAETRDEVAKTAARH